MRDVACENADSPIVVTLAGIVILVRDVFSLNALAAIEATPSGIVISPVQVPIPVTSVAVPASEHPFALATGVDKPEERITKATARPKKRLICSHLYRNHLRRPVVAWSWCLTSDLESIKFKRLGCNTFK